MSLLITLIANLEDDWLKERLQERLDIVRHKIKFMDKVAVCCLDTENRVQNELAEFINEAGGLVLDDPDHSAVLIYQEKGVAMFSFMGALPVLLNYNWPAVRYDRVYILETDDFMGDPEWGVELVEDLAELLHPGSFVFGNEGQRWAAFKTK